MELVPDIVISRSDYVVDDVVYRRSLLGDETWTVTWRATEDPEQREETVLHRSDSIGSASVGTDTFHFVVSWRPDLRRKPLDRGAEKVVTPDTVLQLTELSDALVLAAGTKPA